MKPYQIIVGIVILALILLVHRDLLRNNDTEPIQNAAVQQQQDTGSTVAVDASTDLPGLEEHIRIINEMKKDTFESTEEFEQRRDKEIAKMEQAAAKGNVAYQAGTLTMRKYDADREILTADLVWKEEVLALLPYLKIAESALMKIPRQEAKKIFSEQKSHPFCITVQWKKDAVRFAKIVMAGKNDKTWSAVPAIEPELVAIPNGTLVIDDEQYEKNITIAPFYLGKYEVTFAEWDICALAGGCSYSPENIERGRRAVDNVSHDDVQKYIKWLNQVTGRTYRLPTIYEWHHAACRGRASEWSYDIVEQPENNVVGEGKADQSGLYDLYGNVGELCVQSQRLFTVTSGVCFHPYYSVKKKEIKTQIRYNGIGFRLALSKNK